MDVQQIMAELKLAGDDKIKAILLKHGVKEPFFGVKVEFLKVIQKKVKKNYQLAKDLYATGNADAMYLAGLIADDVKMTKDDLQLWVQQAVSQNISEYTVPWVAAESLHGWELALEWITSTEEHIAAAGWSTLSNLVALKPDASLDIEGLRQLLATVVKNIHNAPNRVRSTMNMFVISTGAYVTALTAEVYALAAKIGAVTVDVGDTACKVPDAATYIKKIEDRGSLGKKKKTVKC